MGSWLRWGGDGARLCGGPPTGSRRSAVARREGGRRDAAGEALLPPSLVAEAVLPSILVARPWLGREALRPPLGLPLIPPLGIPFGLPLGIPMVSTFAHSLHHSPSFLPASCADSQHDFLLQ